MERKCRVSSIPASGEGISHLFGIYRTRTPDIKKSRLIRIRFIFVPVILGSLLLVIFLTIIDVSRSSSNAKPLPFARLSHLHSYDSVHSGRQNYTNGNTNKTTRSHIHKNITGINVENSRSYNDELGFKGYETFTFNRTRLHKIKNSVDQLNSRLLVEGNNLNIGEQDTQSPFNDYTQGSINLNEDDKIDRRGIAYFDSTSETNNDAEGADGLQNNKRKMLRTGRIMNNPKLPHLINKFSDSLSISSQYLNPPFTATPMYSNTFAQLGPYQRVKNVKSIGDVLKYVIKQNPSNVYITNTVTPESVAVKKAVKFTGTYKMPTESSELGNSYGGRINQNNFKGFGSTYSQSYVPFYDPFKNFKPVNPSEINKLISTGTNADSVTSFSNKVYFTEPSNTFNFASTTPRPFFEVKNVYNNQSRYHTSGSHTIAVFKPLEPTSSYSSGFTTQMPAEITKRRTKPFSVTLDIYPMTMERDQVSSGNSPQPSYQVSAPNKNRPLHPRWKHRPVGPLRGPRFRKPSNVNSHDNGGPENHMIVHLNVFPNRSKKQSRQGRGREVNESVLNTVIAGGTFGHRNFDSDSLAEDYDDINSSFESNDTAKTESEFYLTTGNVSDSADLAFENKVSYDFLQGRSETQDSINGERNNDNTDVSDGENIMDKSTTSKSDAETITEKFNRLL